ncbi:MAG TPA: hypothetical protein VFV02_17135 [Acidimicrobiales bacterium]|nr:hypothetical protein [Acidimicrobiales bacterium]
MDEQVQQQPDELTRMQAVLDAHRERLLGIPGCTAVAIGRKQTGGRETERLAIVVFVEQKVSSPAQKDAIPPELAGIPTDVVEYQFSPKVVVTNPHERFDPLISGIAITPDAVPNSWGSIGCFVHTTGKAGHYAAGDYLLTNEHVLHHAGIGGVVIQPDWQQVTPPPANYTCGTYLEGFRNVTHDCGLVDLVGRGWLNEVPNRPWHPGNRQLRGVTGPAIGTQVYKFGASTLYTTATVRFINWSDPGHTIQNALYIRNDNHDTWVDGGDSGSVAVTYNDDLIMGLNFRADTNYPANNGVGYYAGLAYPIQSQMDMFCDPGGAVRLA